MSRKRIDRWTAGFVFLWALTLYLATMAPTASFWDPGERIASVRWLQVMHPPGAPFYMLVGRLFSMLAPSPDTVAWMVNLISVLASAGTVMLTHLIIVRLVRRWQQPTAEQPTGQYVIGLSSGVIGALTYAATDSFWFNAGIAEVYALSTFFTALVVWLVLRWSEAARAEEAQIRGDRHPYRLSANRFLVLIAFLFGLAIGTHLLSLLAFFFVGLIVFFTEFDEDHWTPKQRWLRIVGAGVIASALFLTIYPGIIVGVPSLVQASGFPPTLLILAFVGLLAYGIYTTHQRGMPLANLGLICLAVIMIGYGSYSLVFVRSATDPPIDMNDPDTMEGFISYLQREQYGDTPLLRGRTFNDETGQVNRRDGETQWFPRRHSVRPKHWDVYKRYDSDLQFFLQYQVGYMYVRYFLWNFSGRSSDEQGAQAITGIPFVDPASATEKVMRTPSEKESRNVYFALPLLLGLFGAFYHFNQDWRRAFSVFVLFFMTGIGIILYLNQAPMQPRARDYSYVGSFLAFSLWIGIGAGGILQMLYEAIEDRWAGLSQAAPLLGLGALVFLAVPGWMTVENYGDHDRSGNYVPHDYAHNMLNSVAEDAVIFTNGDNDTYPLWYLQQVEGVRRDVRVVNLSLLNTRWYVRQLKNEQAFNSEPLPISLSDDEISKLRPTRWEPREVTLPVDSSAIHSKFPEYLSDDASVTSPMTWTLRGSPYQKDTRILEAADRVAYNILLNSARGGWDRPVYFAVTVAQSGQLNLQNYLQLEGQAYRVLPFKHDATYGRVIPGLTDKRIGNFQYTNLADSSVYYNENARRMVNGYRLHVPHAVEQLSRKGYTAQADSLLNRFVNEVPFSTISGDVQTILFTARAFEALGDSEKASSIIASAEPLVMDQLAEAGSRRAFSRALQYAGLVRRAYVRSGDQEMIDAFDDALDDQLAQAPFQVPQRVRRAYGLASDTSAAPGGFLQQPGPAPSQGGGQPPSQPATPQQSPSQGSQSSSSPTGN
jgi:MFS family permease